MDAWIWLVVALVLSAPMLLLLVGLCRASADADRRQELAYARMRAQARRRGVEERR